MQRSSIYREITIYPTSDTLYQYADGAFHLLYDYGAEVGDTLEIYVPMVEDGRSFYHTVRIDSVGIELINGTEFRKVFQRTIASGVGGYLFDGWAIEYMGCTSQYFTPKNDLQCLNMCPSSLECFETNVNNFNTGSGFYFASCEQVIMTDTDGPLQDLSSQLRAFPNPASSGGTVRVQLPELAVSGEEVHLELVDQTGRIVNRQTLSTASRSTVLRIDELPAGPYYLRWTSDGAFATSRLIIGDWQ